MTTFNPALKSEIHQMASDILFLENERSQTTDLNQFKNIFDKLDAIREKNLPRLHEIIDQYGWPNNDLVGQDGSSHFCTLIHRSCDEKLTRKALEALRLAITEKKADQELAKPLEFELAPTFEAVDDI